MTKALQIKNDPKQAGALIRPRSYFGDNNRYSFAPIHTRFEDHVWFVWDHETPDELDLPSVIAQVGDDQIGNVVVKINAR